MIKRLNKIIANLLEIPLFFIFIFDAICTITPASLLLFNTPACFRFQADIPLKHPNPLQSSISSISKS